MEYEIKLKKVHQAYLKCLLKDNRQKLDMPRDVGGKVKTSLGFWER